MIPNYFCLLYQANYAEKGVKNQEKTLDPDKF